MDEIPSYASPPVGMAKARLSAASIVSFVCGVLFCLPLFTSIVAIICGIIGIRATRTPAVRGRGFAIAGLVLGIVGMLLWVGGVGGFVSFIVVGSRAPRAALHDFAGNMTAGNTAAATAECVSSITADDIEGLHTKVATFGSYTDLTCYSVSLNGGADCQLTVSMQFSSGTRSFEAELVKDSAGAWKIQRFFVR